MTLKETILSEAVRLATSFTLGGVTRRRVASAAHCGVGTVNYHFKTMAALRDAIMTHAIKNENMPLLALYLGVPRYERRITPELRKRVVAYLASR